jgi:orotate phosphoribosyltransferase
MPDSTLAAEVDRVSRISGTFILRSGQKATEYFDKYRFESDPALLRRIASELAPLIPPPTEVLAGLELGGIPIATALSFETGLPVAFVRKVAKTYGTARLAEGAELAGRNVLVVEDVVTSGGQVVASSEDLRRLGALVAHALCVVDREQGGRANLEEAGIELRALFSRSELDRARGAGASP